ncbi:MAG: alpha/beta hydrolase [Proteobacteria bacterium]|nr:alpha/beta hydrolase [Pseudomonadota bacterium]
MLKTKGLEYEIQGDGEPILLIHGSILADAFLPLTNEAVLSDHYKLIRYHRRGFADSDPITGAFSIEEQAQDALTLLHALGIQRAHVIGHSYGAVTALQLACQAPSAVHSLVLLEPPKTTEEPESMEEFEPLIAQFSSGDVIGAVDSFMAMVGGPDWRSEVQRTVPDGPEQAERDAATFFDIEFPALGNWILSKDKASRISHPILYLLGAESDPMFDKAKQAFKSIVTHTEEVLLPGLNHLFMIRNPSQVAIPIADFLARHPI